MQSTSEVKQASKFQQLSLMYSQDTAKLIQSSKLLVVGAGGIGCELVKCLSLTGFTSITIIDLDTIDVSNLNRQFLFRREHVDQPKSIILKKQIESQNKFMKIDAHLGKIQEDRFGFHFFKEFDLVINALDNEEARKHVNKFCFNLGKPLVDAGTNGYDMTCVSIMKGRTPCYECIERQKDQTFPVCTIRQRPEKLIHCIVWAKALYEGIYGPKEAASTNIIEDIVEDLEKARKSSAEQFAQILIDKVFGSEPESLMNTLKQGINKDDIHPEEKAETEKFIALIKPCYFKDFPSFMDIDQTATNGCDEKEMQTKVHDLAVQVKNFVVSIEKLKDHKDVLFTKDDPVAVEFVTAATNIRASNFSIQMATFFKIKEMAGKIVPAISSSNALGASLQVLECIKLLERNYKATKGILYLRASKTERLQSCARLSELPNSVCQICSDDSLTIVLLSLKQIASFTLQDLRDKILFSKESGVGLNGQGLYLEVEGKLIYELFPEDEEDDEEEKQANLNKLCKNLAQYKIKHQSIVQAQGPVEEDTSDGTDPIFYIQIFEVPEQSDDFKIDIVKKGDLSKRAKKIEEENKNVGDFSNKIKDAKTASNDEEVEISSDECVEMEEMMTSTKDKDNQQPSDQIEVQTANSEVIQDNTHESPKNRKRQNCND